MQKKLEMLANVSKRKCIDNPEYINGFYKYLIMDSSSKDLATDVYKDIKKFIDCGYLVIVGEDWGEELIIYGYELESEREIFYYRIGDKEGKKESLLTLLTNVGFFSNNRIDKYLRLRPIKENTVKRKKIKFFKRS